MNISVVRDFAITEQHGRGNFVPFDVCVNLRFRLPVQCYQQDCQIILAAQTSQAFYVAGTCGTQPAPRREKIDKCNVRQNSRTKPCNSCL